MIDDITFHSSYFYLELPVFSSGVINTPIEWSGQSEAFAIRLALPERISVS
jgi:hypothetical protein